MPIQAICIRCGERKRAAYQRCGHCEFDPSQNGDDLVKSVYLSLDRYEGDDDRRRYEGELVLMGRALREGGELIDYEPAELSRLRAQKQLVDSIPPRAVWDAVFRLFLPAVIFLGILWLVVYLLRR